VTTAGVDSDSESGGATVGLWHGLGAGDAGAGDMTPRP
jgi:hypothetical protein